MGDKFDRKEHMKKIHSQRKAITHEKVDKAIKILIKNQQEINFNSVANESGLSKKTLYNNTDIKKRIEDLRYQQSQVPTPGQVKREMNESNKDALIASLKRQVKKLREENQKLKEQVDSHENKVYTDFYENL